MEPELDIREDATLAAIRRRGLLYLNYVFWAVALSALLLFAALCSSLFSHWIALLEGSRRTFGIAAPGAGPDYWILAGVGVALAAAGLVVFTAWRMYRNAWDLRLGAVWPEDADARHADIRPLLHRSDGRELTIRSQYLSALAQSPEWQAMALPPVQDSRESYLQTSAAILKTVEAEIAHRAVTAGLVVGLNRNPFVDSVSILAAAMELQFFVLTRLGKQPSFRTWMEMLKRTGSSLFLNWYVSRGDALYLKLAIKKMAWGLEFASELTQHAAGTIEDIDWDEIVGGLGGSVPQPALHIMSALGTVAAKGMTIGAFGIRQLGHFIEATADDLLQGVLAGGILYYHGMALAAECLALDREHRASAEMNRTIPQAMAVACAPAGKILRDQVRAMRQFLRERRRMMFANAKNTAVQTATSASGGVRAASTRVVDNLKAAYGKLSGNPACPGEP